MPRRHTWKLCCLVVKGLVRLATGAGDLSRRRPVLQSGGMVGKEVALAIATIG